MSIFATAWTWLKGSSISSSLVKTAAIAYGMRLLNDNLNKSSNSGVESTPDPGTRVQVNPTTSFKIPVLYGSAFFGGAITDVELTSNYKTMRYCITLAEQTGVKLSDNTATSYVFNDVYVNNNRVIFKSDGVTVDYTVDKSGNQDVSLRDQVKIYTYLPDPTQPEGYTGTTPAADTVMSSWTAATHPMTGLIYSIVEVTYNRAKNVTGIPNLQFHLTSDMTLPGDVLWDYMRSSRYGGNIPDTDIDNSLVALNTYASDGFSFALPGGVTSTTQYTINGLVNTANNVLANIEEVANNANSWISYDIHTGKWTTVINQMTAVEASLNDDQIVGEISISSTALSQLNSTAEVEFQNSTILDKPDYVRVTVPNEDLYDNEPQTVLEIKLPFINRQATALRVGLQYLKQGRVDKIISFTTDYSYLNLRAGDLIDITSSAFGFVNKEFRIIDAEEVESDTGEILISFKCLEYDEDVYYHDIEEYTVETDDGLLGIGTIGIPGTPQFSKIESDRRPRVTLESVSPAGVVEALEFWITSDVALAENQRTYRLLSSRYPTELVTETWPEGTNVRYDDDTLTSGDFLVKTRGVNSIVVGPFSEPSGLIEFVPQQTTDRIGPETQTMDALGQIVGALTLFSLLNKLFEMFDDPSAADKGIFERIFDLFREETGVDLVEDAAAGTSSLTIQSDGTNVTEKANKLNFVNATVTAAGDVTNVEVPVGADGEKGDKGDPGPAGPAGPRGLDAVGAACMAPRHNEYLVWNSAKDAWMPVPACCPTTFPGDCDRFELKATFTMEVEGCINTLREVERYPNDRPTWYEQGSIQPIMYVPNTGSLFIRYEYVGSEPGCCPDQGQTAPLFKSTGAAAGNAELWLSNGTLVQTLTSADVIIHNDIVEFPFSDRVMGADYYVVIEKNIVNYCKAANPSINVYDIASYNPKGSISIDDVWPSPWNFNTASYYLPPYEVLDENEDSKNYILVPTKLPEFEDWDKPKWSKINDIGPTIGGEYCLNELEPFKIYFNEPVVKEDGRIRLVEVIKHKDEYEEEYEELVDIVSIDIAAATLEDTVAENSNVVLIKDSILNFGYLTPYVTWGKQYRVFVDSKLVSTTRVFEDEDCCGYYPSVQYPPHQSINPKYVVNFSIVKDIELVEAKGYDVTTASWKDTNVDLRTSIRIIYNRGEIYASQTAPANVHLYKGDGTLIQTFDLTNTWVNNRVNELWEITSTPTDDEEDNEVRNTLQLNPTFMLEKGTEYYVLIDDGAVLYGPCIGVDIDEVEYTNLTEKQKEALFQPHKGTTDPQLLRIKTYNIELKDSDTNNPPPTQIPLNTMEVNIPLDRPMKAGDGPIEVRDSLGNLVMTIPADSDALSVV